MELRAAVCQGNLDLVRQGLVILTWGNVSAVDRAAGVMWIKPSGVSYERMTPDDMVGVRLADGAPLRPDGLRPSSDTPTHLAFYRAWPGVAAVVHTHSEYATAAAQACRPIPALGTTHADHFHGPVPCTRALSQAEVEGEYEAATGAVVVADFAAAGRDPLAVPGVLVAQHGPFAWGASVAKAVENAVVLERLAAMAVHTRILNPAPPALPGYLLDRHYLRKHGPGATYGQR